MTGVESSTPTEVFLVFEAAESGTNQVRGAFTVKSNAEAFANRVNEAYEYSPDGPFWHYVESCAITDGSGMLQFKVRLEPAGPGRYLTSHEGGYPVATTTPTKVRRWSGIAAGSVSHYEVQLSAPSADEAVSAAIEAVERTEREQ